MDIVSFNETLKTGIVSKGLMANQGMCSVVILVAVSPMHRTEHVSFISQAAVSVAHTRITCKSIICFLIFCAS